MIPIDIWFGLSEQASSIMFNDFLAAVNSVRRALSIYETRGQQVDWKTVRGMVSLQVCLRVCALHANE